MKDAIVLSPVVSIIWVFIGIVISLVLPIAVKVLQKATPDVIGRPSFRQRVVAAWVKYGGNKYLKILLAAIFVAIVVVFLLGLKFFLARDAALAGFSWESLVNKLWNSSRR